MQFDIKSKRNWLWIFLGLFTLIGMGVSEYAFLNEAQVGIKVNIEDINDHYFITEKEIQAMIRQVQEADSGRTAIRQFDLRVFEEKLRENPFVRDVQVSRDLKGNLIFEIEQDKPIARIMTPYGRGGYITSEYKVLPLSKNYSARTVVLSGVGADSLFSENYLRSKPGQQIMRFVEYINDDEFWQAQLTQLDFERDMDITIIPQVGRQKIIFGTAEAFEQKLEKLTIFYERIIPKKGWTAYSTVNLKYDKQIVCR